MKKKEKNIMENLAYEYVDKVKKYTYQDLLEINDGNRYEIIDGELYMMAAPTVIHQSIVVEISTQLSNYLKGKQCKTFVSPIDVCLSKDYKPNKVKDIVQPDIIVVCDKDKITEKYIKGAPNLVIEVVSDSSRRRDFLEKFNLYQKYKVKEYWIIDVESETIFQYILNEKNIYTLPKVYDVTEDVKVNVLNDCTISLKELMKEIKNT